MLLRVARKRDLAQLHSFDLVVTLLLSNVVQNAVIGNDNSLAAGLFGVAGLVGVKRADCPRRQPPPPAHPVFEGSPTTLVKSGEVIVPAVHRLGMHRSDVAAVCRRQGADHRSDIEEATLWPGGSFVFTLVEERRDATVADLRRSNEDLLAQVRTELSATVNDLEHRVTRREKSLVHNGSSMIHPRARAAPVAQQVRTIMTRE